MLEGLSKNISRGVQFLKENPQILYTVFLLVVIPLAFLFSGQKFLDVAVKNQERLEKERIGLMQDVFALTAISSIDKFDEEESNFLQEVILNIKDENQDISEFKVLARDDGENIIVASLDESEIGEEDKANEVFYGIAGADLNSSFISEHFESGERQWRAIRAIKNQSGDAIGFIMTNISMASIDNAVARNVRDAYFILFFIVIAIFILLLRQTKIVDYSILYKRLKNVDKIKDDFISIAAHELRTPLTAIAGYVDMLSRDNLSENDKENIRRVDVSIKRLKDLINDILDVARIQQGSLKFFNKKTDVSNTIQSVVDSFQEIADKKSISLEYDKKPIPEISVDIGRFEEVLVNLIGNALKYTFKGSVKVIVTKEKISDNDYIQIRISDTGVGISSDNQQFLFQRFYRIRTSDTADITGTGLGLWISRQIVLGMGGKITVESIKGKGSDFIISFPVV